MILPIMDVQSLVTALMVWVSSTGALPLPDAQPVVKFAPQEYIGGLYCKATMDYVRREYPNMVEVTSCNPEAIQGLHMYPVIYLPDTWRPNSLLNVSELLHETVHFMQIHSGIHYGCEARKEQEAYKIQRKYIESTGKDFWEVTGYDQLRFVTGNGRCHLD